MPGSREDVKQFYTLLADCKRSCGVAPTAPPIAPVASATTPTVAPAPLPAELQRLAFSMLGSQDLVGTSAEQLKDYLPDVATSTTVREFEEPKDLLTVYKVLKRPDLTLALLQSGYGVSPLGIDALLREILWKEQQEIDPLDYPIVDFLMSVPDRDDTGSGLIASLSQDVRLALFTWLIRLFDANSSFAFSEPERIKSTFAILTDRVFPLVPEDIDRLEDLAEATSRMLGGRTTELYRAVMDKFDRIASRDDSKRTEDEDEDDSKIGSATQRIIDGIVAYYRHSVCNDESSLNEEGEFPFSIIEESKIAALLKEQIDFFKRERLLSDLMSQYVGRYSANMPDYDAIGEQIEKLIAQGAGRCYYPINTRYRDSGKLKEIEKKILLPVVSSYAKPSLAPRTRVQDTEAFAPGQLNQIAAALYQNTSGGGDGDVYRYRHHEVYTNPLLTQLLATAEPGSKRYKSLINKLVEYCPADPYLCAGYADRVPVFARFAKTVRAFETPVSLDSDGQ